MKSKYDKPHKDYIEDSQMFEKDELYSVETEQKPLIVKMYDKRPINEYAVVVDQLGNYYLAKPFPDYVNFSETIVVLEYIRLPLMFDVEEKIKPSKLRNFRLSLWQKWAVNESITEEEIADLLVQFGD